MFTNDAISLIRLRDAEERAAEVPASAVQIRAARSVAERAGNYELADMLERRLAAEFPERKDYYAIQESMTTRLVAIAWEHKRSTEAARIQSLRQTAQISQSVAADMYRPLLERWVSDIEEIDAEARQLRADATREVEKIILKITAPHPGTVQDQLLFESQADRAWARLRAELDALDVIDASSIVVKHITEATSPQARKFLIEEGSAYLRGRGYREIDESIRAALVKADPRVAVADAEETNAHLAASAVQLNAARTLERVKVLPDPRERPGDFERALTDHYLIGERTPLGRAAARAAQRAQIAERAAAAGFTLR